MAVTRHLTDRGRHLTADIWKDPERFRQYWTTIDPFYLAPESKAARERAAALLAANPRNLDFSGEGLVREPPTTLGRLHEIRVPTLIVVGEHDIADVHAHAGAIQAAVSDARRIVVPACGHGVPLERAELLSLLVLEHLQNRGFFTVLSNQGVEAATRAFLDCGLPEAGFARVRCSSCRHEFLLAFSCGMRGFCMSCHSKRAALWAEHLAEHVLLSVPHDQWVFTVPKRLRLFFLYDRTLLGDLARCAWSTVRDLYLAGLPNRSAAPGMVASAQTYGDQAANWQPHIHALVTSGLIDPDGEFTPLDRTPSAVAEELFRRRVLKMLVDHGKLDEDTAAGILGWQHTGFSAHNSIRVEPDYRGAWRGSATTWSTHSSRSIGSMSRGQADPAPTADGALTRSRASRVSPSTCSRCSLACANTFPLLAFT